MENACHIDGRPQSAAQVEPWSDRAMIRQICSIKPENVAMVRSRELLEKVELEDLNLILRERMWNTGCWQAGDRETLADMEQTDGERLLWVEGASGDQLWDLLCVQLASYLEGGPPMWMMPLHINQ